MARQMCKEEAVSVDSMMSRKPIPDSSFKLICCCLCTFFKHCTSWFRVTIFRSCPLDSNLMLKVMLLTSQP